jgi:uncharacterized membrane protein
MKQREKEECITQIGYEGSRKSGNVVETAVTACIIHSKTGELGKEQNSHKKFMPCRVASVVGGS